MTLPVLVLRPEPGASATARRGEASGLAMRLCPLFAAHPVAWSPPPVSPDTRLLMTSANAARLGGAQLAALGHLPCWCVGAATATAAREAGLNVVHVGNGDASALVAAMDPDDGPILWLCGVQRSEPLWPDGAQWSPLAVYTMAEMEVPPDALRGPAIALVHSARAAIRLATLAGNQRSAIHIVAISAAVARAAGSGWRSITAAPAPDDQAMIAMAVRLQTCSDQSPPLQ